MLQGFLIGYLGADAECKTSNGKEFTAFRIADSNKWTDDAGVQHEETTWVDCIMNGKPNVLPWLKKGQLVYVMGTQSLRVYSSKKDRCMKAGLTINVRSIELLGGKSDDVPSVLYGADGQTEYKVAKWYYSEQCKRAPNAEEWLPLMSRSQEKFIADRNGFVYPYKESEE